VLTEQLQGALNSRVVIEQAKGALAQMHSCSIDEAFDVLRGYCRSHGLGLSEVARRVVAEPRAFLDLRD
jgi:AmiR/NasT family two-component response regulator